MDTATLPNDGLLFDFSQMDYSNLPQLGFDPATLQCLADATSGSSLLPAPSANMQTTGHQDQSSQDSTPDFTTEELKQ